jgi:phage regulator Rha-like protein
MVSYACVIGRIIAMKVIKETKATNTTLIIHGSNNQICVSSRDVAKEFGRSHKNVLRSIDALLADGTITRLTDEPCFYTKLGRKHRYYELNKREFLICMPFIGGKKAHEGQKKLVDMFLALEKKLEKQLKEKAKLSCQVARLSGKTSRDILCAKIDVFKLYAKDQGSKSYEKYFCLFTSLCNNSVFTTDQKVTQPRELMTAIQLAQLSMVELIVEDTLSTGIELGLPYKAIYQMVKVAVEGLVIRQPILVC